MPCGGSSIDTKSSSKKTVLADEQNRPDVAEARARWKANQHRLDAKRLVFIDETWAKTNMHRSHGRCSRGERLIGRAPHGHWRTSTFVAGLRHDGIIAPLIFDRPMNGQIFQFYVATQLAPALRPGDTVVMDNLGSHKSQAVKDAIRARGAHLIFLPPYSPDLNPIEKLFSKLKALLRAAAERTVDALWDRVGQILEQISKAECQNYIRYAGYE
jgi:transposase